MVVTRRSHVTFSSRLLDLFVEFGVLSVIAGSGFGAGVPVNIF